MYQQIHLRQILSLTISDVFQTMMACMDEDVMKQEAAFTTALTAAQSFVLEGNSLTITYDGGVLHFAPVRPIADQTFEGTRWQTYTEPQKLDHKLRWMRIKSQ